jgi:hypothetical protein
MSTKRKPLRKQIQKGERFGRWVAISDGWMSDDAPGQRVRVQCDCGTRRTMTAAPLWSGGSKSCGCLRREVTSSRSLKPIVKGQRFGRLVTVSKGWTEDGRQLVETLCDCGTRKTVPVKYLRSKRVPLKSCGCTKLEKLMAIHHQKLIRANQRFGRLVAVADGWTEGGKQLVRVRCDCGKTKTLPAISIKSSHTQSCGCLHRERSAATAVRKLRVGQRFARLVVIKDSWMINHRHRVLVRCDCGQEVERSAWSVRSGRSQSCGCYHRERSSIVSTEMLRNKTNLRKRWKYRGRNGVLFMRSSWELAFALECDAREIAWEYEPRSFKLAEGLRYTPDFYLTSVDEWVEIKGDHLARAFEKKRLLFRASGRRLRVISAARLRAFTRLAPQRLNVHYAKHRVSARQSSEATPPQILRSAKKPRIDRA